MHEAQVRLQLVEEDGGRGVAGPKERVVVGEGGEEQAEEETGRCKEKGGAKLSKMFLFSWVKRVLWLFLSNLRPTIMCVAKDPDPRAILGSSTVLNFKKLILTAAV